MKDLFPSVPLSLGRPKEGRRLRLNVPERARSEHMHVIGATGSGKSRFLLHMILQDIVEGRGVCLIDPHGELYDHVVQWLSNRQGLFEDRNIRLINPSDVEWAFGFNPLKVRDPLSLPTVVDSTATGLSHVMGGENIRETPLLNETMRAICYALASADLTLVEAPYLYTNVHQREREYIISKIKNPIAQTDWKSYAQYRPVDYDEFFRPAARRIRPFIQNDLMRHIFGQKENTLDFKKSMDDGDVLLINLSRVGGRLTEEDQQVLGRLIINNLVARAYERDPLQAKAFYLYIDEVQNFLSGDVPEILSQTRKYGLHLVMAHQFLEQLRHAGDLVFHGIMGTANNKVVFKLQNPEDAELMAERVFAGSYNYKMEKDYKPVVVGHRIRKFKSETKQESETGTKSLTKTSVNSYSHAQAFSESSSRGENTGEGASAGMVFGVDNDSLGDAYRAMESNSTFNAENWSNSSGTSFANGESQSTGLNSSSSTATSEGYSSGYSEGLEPIIEREPGSYYSLEEQKQVFKDSLIRLDNRHAFAVISGHESIAFKTETLEDELFSPKTLKKMRDKCYLDSPVHSPTEKVIEAIKSTSSNLLRDSNQAPEDDDYFTSQ